MTAIDPVTTIDPTTTIAPERHITVEGTVEIGRRLAVTAGRRSRASLETPDSEFRPPMPRFRGPRARLIQPVPFGEDPVRFIERDLRPTPDTVAFRDKGLALSYAVFGQPGSGKTHLLRNVLYDLLAGGPDNARLRLDPDQRFGALIVDPKGELVRDVVDILEATGRSDDLRLVNTQALERSGGGMNLLDVQLDPSEKAVALVLAAQCAGESPKDPFWVKSWTNVFIGAAHILHALGRDVTLAALVEATMGRDAGADARHAGDDTTQRSPLRAKRAAEIPRALERLVREGREQVAKLTDYGARQDLELAIGRVSSYLQQRGDNAAVVEVLVATAFGDFCRAKYKACYSAKHPAPKYRRLYDQIIEDGRVVVVSNGFEERNFTGALVPLVKTLFQRTVLSRFSLADDERLRNTRRPVLLLCDEYQEVVSEVPGAHVGDANFFNLARQFGCMGLVASQSLSTVRAALASDDERAWKAIYASLGAAIFFRTQDPDTIKQAVDAAGTADAFVTSKGASFGESPGFSLNTQLVERKRIQDAQIAQLTQGQALVVGTLDNNHASAEFVDVGGEWWKRPEKGGTQ